MKYFFLLFFFLFNFKMMKIMRRKNGSGELLATTVWSSTGTQSSLAKARLLLRLIKGWTAPTFWKKKGKVLGFNMIVSQSFAGRIWEAGTINQISGKCIWGSLQRSLCLGQQHWWSPCSRGEKEGFELFAAVFPGSAVVSEFGRLWEKDPRELLQHNIKPVRGHALVLWRVAQGDFVMFC